MRRVVALFSSIRWRLVASYVLLTLLTVSVIGVLALQIVGQYVRQQELDDLQANARSIARQAQPLMMPQARLVEMARLAQTAAYLGEARVRILDARRQPLADSGAPSPAADIYWIAPPVEAVPLAIEAAPWPGILMFPGGERQHAEKFEAMLLEGLPPGTAFTLVRRVEGPWGGRFTFEATVQPGELPQEDVTLAFEGVPRSNRVVFEPVGDPGDPLGFVELSAGPDYGVEAMAATRKAFTLAGAGATLLALVVGLVISQRLTSPLHSLSEIAGRMGDGDLSVRATLHSRDEIGHLAVRFNQMAERLETSFTQLRSERDAMRRFIADASHELRTPVTALKNFNTLLRGPAVKDRAARTEFLSESQTQIERLEWITRNLLDLSRIDAGLVELEMNDHPVSEILQAAAAPFHTLAADRGISLTVIPPDASLLLNCDRQRLEMALSNLLDNAIKFTPAGGQVEIGAEQTAQGVHIWVRDDGSGISPEDLAHIFERFYRGRGHLQMGSGLGLSIAESLIRLQGGAIHVESVPGQGACFTLEWILENNSPDNL